MLAVRTSAYVLVACMAAGCEDPGPCIYEERELASDTITYWGTTVGEDFAALVGPYEGTWIWSVSVEELEIANSGLELPARATLQIDSSSYRESVLVSGGARRRNDRFFCSANSILADGTITFSETDGTPFIEIPVTLTRDEGANTQYASIPYFTPVSEFSPALMPMPQVEFDEEGISGTLIWGPDRQWLDAEFIYVAQRTVSESMGHIQYVDVAEFRGE